MSRGCTGSRLGHYGTNQVGGRHGSIIVEIDKNECKKSIPPKPCRMPSYPPTRYKQPSETDTHTHTHTHTRVRKRFHTYTRL